jgi:hypothetical protein
VLQIVENHCNACNGVSFAKPQAWRGLAVPIEEKILCNNFSTRNGQAGAV